MVLSLKSSEFIEGQQIPKPFTGEGTDRSPALDWANIPNGTKELALICDDPDAPTPEPWVHWVMYKIPPDLTKLGEGIPTDDRIKELDGVIQGKNTWGRIGYGGPMPPVGHGWHRYFFKLYALDSSLNLEPGATKDELLKAMDGHILAETELMGKYRRD